MDSNVNISQNQNNSNLIQNNLSDEERKIIKDRIKLCIDLIRIISSITCFWPLIFTSIIDNLNTFCIMFIVLSFILVATINFVSVMRVFYKFISNSDKKHYYNDLMFNIKSVFITEISILLIYLIFIVSYIKFYILLLLLIPIIISIILIFLIIYNFNKLYISPGKPLDNSFKISDLCIILSFIFVIANVFVILFGTYFKIEALGLTEKYNFVSLIFSNKKTKLFLETTEMKFAPIFIKGLALVIFIQLSLYIILFIRRVLNSFNKESFFRFNNYILVYNIIFTVGSFLLLFFTKSNDYLAIPEDDIGLGELVEYSFSGIILLIIFSIISLILLFVVIILLFNPNINKTITIFEKNISNNNTNYNNQVSSNSSINFENRLNLLEKLKNLLDNGVITQEDYDIKKKEILFSNKTEDEFTSITKINNQNLNTKFTNNLVNNFENKLKQIENLDALLNNGSISKEEYDERKRNILTNENTPIIKSMKMQNNYSINNMDNSFENRLKQLENLDTLLNNSSISKEEYDERKRNILES